MPTFAFQFALAFAALQVAFAQGAAPRQPPPENILSQARALTKNKQSDRALALLDAHLKTNPDDLDARVLLGLILSWESHYDEGRKALESVLAADNDYKDARMALINLERWADQPDRAAALALEGLRMRPKDPEFEEQLKKALQQSEAEKKKKKAGSQPSKPSAAAEALEHPQASWEFGADRNQIWFSDKRSTWTEQAFLLAKNTPYGWVSARFQRAEQGGTHSSLMELEMYPRLRPGLYGLISGAFSPDANLYAHRRFATELFQSLPRGYEASLGYRYFRFNEGVNMVTGSVAKYFGNWWFSGRTFLTPGSEGLSRSVQFSARRYYRDADHYIGFRGGIGASPFEIRSINETGNLDSETLGFEALWKFRNRLRMRMNAGVSRQERIFTRQYLWLYSTGLTLYYGL